jgi:hypothetical protein
LIALLDNFREVIRGVLVLIQDLVVGGRLKVMGAAQPWALLLWPHRERPSTTATASFWNAAEEIRKREK